MLAIITGTIRPNGHMGQLVLKNEEERLKQYKDALLFTIQSKAFSKIIFCENSGYDMEVFMDLKQEAVKCKEELELLSFAGDSEAVLNRGKGYGEGEIMYYVFRHSQLLNGESYFVKITGRLLVDNIAALASRLRMSRIYFNIPNRTIRDIYDTRIYAMPIPIFKEKFLDKYEGVMDKKGVFLEHVYTGILKEEKFKVYNFPRYPRIRGISGSGGVRYEYTEWKCLIKDLLSKINYYGVKE